MRRVTAGALETFMLDVAQMALLRLRLGWIARGRNLKGRSLQRLKVLEGALQHLETLRLL